MHVAGHKKRQEFSSESAVVLEKWTHAKSFRILGFNSPGPG